MHTPAHGYVLAERKDKPVLPRSAVARSFGSAAQHYDHHAILQRAVADKLFSLLPTSVECGAVLDIGCGTGYCTRQLRTRFPASALVALDIALPMLKKTRQHMQETAALQLVCADATALPLRSTSVDLVFSSLAVQWCSDYARLFGEVQRVLAPGGLALLSTFGPATLQELRAAWAQVDGHTHVNEFVAFSHLQHEAALAGLQCDLRSESVAEPHESLYALSQVLKGIGAHNMNTTRPAGLTSPRQFRRAAEYFAAGAEDGVGIPVTWEIFYLILRKPA